MFWLHLAAHLKADVRTLLAVAPTHTANGFRKASVSTKKYTLFFPTLNNHMRHVVDFRSPKLVRDPDAKPWLPAPGSRGPYSGTGESLTGLFQP